MSRSRLHYALMLRAWYLTFIKWAGKVACTSPYRNFNPEYCPHCALIEASDLCDARMIDLPYESITLLEELGL